MRPTKILRAGVLAILGLWQVGANAALTPAERADLTRLVRQDCGSCHGMRLTGGLGTPLTREAMADKPVDYLVATILNSRPGSAMPAWKSLLSETQARWIAEQLVAGFPEESR